MNRPPDRPAFHIAPNASRPGLVLVALGSGVALPYSVTPEFALQLAAQLTVAADAARSTLSCAGRR